MTFFYKNAINIFTDASVCKVNNKWVSCSGFIAVYNGRVINQDYKIFYDATNGYGELYAIKLGVEYAISVGKETDLFLNIISDSLISINNIRKWIFEWKYSEEHPYLLKTKQGTIVSNQDLVLNIVGMIIYSGIHMNFYHILGHKNSASISDLVKVQEAFKKHNEIDIRIPDEIYQEMMSYNSMIDRYSRNHLYTIIKNKEYTNTEYQKFKFPCIWTPNQYDIQVYKQLIS